MDKLACMRTFVSVVESGGFSEAARRLGVSKALISKQVNQLEDSLGVRLLHRTTRRISATSSGQAYFEQCRPLLHELQELDASLQSANAHPSGAIHVAAPTTYAEIHLMTVVSEYSRRYTDVTVNLHLTDRFVDLVEERIDVAIRIGNLGDSTLVARKLGDITMQLCASRDYLAINGAPDSPQQLSDHQCVLDSNYPGANHWTLGKVGKGEKGITVEVQSRLIVNSARAARDLVLAGHGIGYLPSFAVADDISEGRLKHLLSEYASKPIGIYAVYLHRKHLSARVRLFIDLAVEYCSTVTRD